METIDELTKTWDKKAPAGATQAVIDDVQQLVGYELPKDLIDFMRQHNGASGYMSDDEDDDAPWVRINPIEEWVPTTRGYDLESRKLLSFGSDGGDGAYAISLKSFPFPFVHALYSGGQTYYGTTFAELLHHLTTKTKPPKPTKAVTAVRPTKLSAPPKDKPQRELKGHTNIVWGMDVSPDGGCVATTSMDGTARVFALATGKQLAVLERQPPEFPSPAVRWIDNEHAFCCQARSSVINGRGEQEWLYRFIEIKSGKEVGRLATARAPDISLDGGFSPDGRQAIVCNPFAAKTFVDIATGDKIADLPYAMNRSFSVAWRNDGELIALGRYSLVSSSGWDTSTGRLSPQPEGHVLLLRRDGIEIGWIKGDSPVLKCAFDAANRLLVVRENDVLIYQTAEPELPGEPIARLTANNRTIASGCFVGPSRIAITTAEGYIYIYDIATGKMVQQFLTTKNQIGVVSARPDGRLLLTANAYTGLSAPESKTVRVWEVRT